MSTDLLGKRCLITGGSRNLGRALAIAMAQQGADVAFVWERSETDAAETLGMLEAVGGRVLSLRGSVADAAFARAAVTEVVEKWGGIDILVNNAGRTQILPIALLEERDWDESMDIHAKGTYLFCRAALRPMIKAKAGSILNIGSFAAEHSLQTPTHYAAAKAAVRGFTQALAMEVGRYGIRVNLLVPGMMTVGLSQRLPKHRVDDYREHVSTHALVSPEDVARTAIFLVSDRNTLMTAASIAVDGGL